jgi:hypothetical protein
MLKYGFLSSTVVGCVAVHAGVTRRLHLVWEPYKLISVVWHLAFLPNIAIYLSYEFVNIL